MLRAVGTAEALRLARFLLLPAKRMGEELFLGEGARLLLAGNAAHADAPVDAPVSGAYGWLLAMMGQQHGFPVPVGGSGELAAAMVEEPWTSRLWVYDLRTNRHFTLKTNPLRRADLDEFVACYRPANRYERSPTWAEATPGIEMHRSTLSRKPSSSLSSSGHPRGATPGTAGQRSTSSVKPSPSLSTAGVIFVATYRTVIPSSALYSSSRTVPETFT